MFLPLNPTPLRSKVEDAIKAEIKAHVEEQGGNELLNIAPKKPNWDLKRDITKKMDKLNRRTQVAIVEIIKERIAQQAAEESSEEESDEEDEEAD